MRLEERLAQDWRRAFSEQLVDSVQDIYDFFQSDTRLFASSALFRLLKHLELRMSSQLRILFIVRRRGVCGADLVDTNTFMAKHIAVLRPFE